MKKDNAMQNICPNCAGGDVGHKLAICGSVARAMKTHDRTNPVSALIHLGRTLISHGDCLCGRDRELMWIWVIQSTLDEALAWLAWWWHTSAGLPHACRADAHGANASESVE